MNPLKRTHKMRQEHVQAGSRNCPWKCPIALILREDNPGYNVAVSGSTPGATPTAQIAPKEEGEHGDRIFPNMKLEGAITLRLSDNAKDFMKHFDIYGEHKTTAPIEFTSEPI